MTQAASRPSWGLVVASVLCVGGFTALAIQDARVGTLRDGYVVQTIGWYLVSFVGFAIAVWWNERHPIPWRWIIAVAVVIRVLMLFTTPTLSDDVYRYLWEGHLLTEGVSPYSAAIGDPSLDEYAIPARALANTQTFASPYLPAVHLVFGAAAAVLPAEPWAMQLVMVTFEAIAVASFIGLLRVVDAPRGRIIIWLWNPLVVVEIAHGAHLDAVMVALTSAAFALAFGAFPKAGRFAVVAAPVLLALATLTRPLPLLVLPMLFWRWTWTQRALYGGVVTALLVPFALWSGLGLRGDEPTGLFGSARIYGESFRFNSAIYQPLETWIGGRGLDDRGWNEPATLTQLIVAATFVCIIVFSWSRARAMVDPLERIRLAAVPVGAYVLLAPVMHPWYVLLLVGLLMFHAPIASHEEHRWVLLLPWGWLSAALVVSYLTYRDPTRFAELTWVRRVQWLPTLMLLVGSIIWYRAQPSARQSVAPSRPQAGLR